MKSLFLIALMVITLTGCQSASDVALNASSKDPVCANNCSSYFNICDVEMSATPIAHHNACVERFRFCTQTCADKGNAPPVPAMSEARGKSARDRLVELDELRAKGLISNAEYDAKRQDILKSM